MVQACLLSRINAMKRMLLLGPFCWWGCLFGQAPVEMFVAEPSLPPLLQARCSSLVQTYYATLNELGSQGQTISEKERLANRANLLFWHSEKTLVYDDLYLTGDRNQYFTGSEYFHTLPAWYPQGVTLAIADVRMGRSEWTSAGDLQVRMSWRRILAGRDYLGQVRQDTTALEGFLVMALSPTADGILLREPSFVWIHPLDHTAPPIVQRQADTIDSVQPSEGVIEVERIAGLDESSRVIPAASATPIDQRAMHLVAAVAQYRATRPTKSSKQPSRPNQRWRPW